MAKKIAGLLGAGMVGIAAGFGGGMMLMPEPEPVVKTVTEEVEVIKEVPVTETVVEEVEVVKEVDNGKLDYLKDSLIDREIMDDEFDPVKVFMAEDEALSRAIVAIEDNGADMIEDNNSSLDEDDLDFYRIYGEWDNVKVNRSDFDHNEYRFEIDALVEDDENHEDYKATFVVDIDDDEVEVTEVKNVTQV